MTDQAPSVKDLLAQARAAEHAATLALQQGNVPLAQVRATIGRLRLGLALRQAAEECLFCNGYGAVPAKCPTGCAEHDPHDRTPRHWVSCPNVVAHPGATNLPGSEPDANSGCPCGGTGDRHRGGVNCPLFWRESTQ